MSGEKRIALKRRHCELSLLTGIIKRKAGRRACIGINSAYASVRFAWDGMRKRGCIKMSRKSRIARFFAGVAAMLLALVIIGPAVSDKGSNHASASDIQPVEINETTFPDPAFRAYISGPEFNPDGDNVLSAEEILLIRDIHCDARGIQSLKGIEYLVELRGLYCTDNRIQTMDLSHNKLLTGVWCSGNLFTSLDFSANPNLEWVYCFDCKLTSLNVSNNPKMSYIECNTNPLGSLDVSHNPLLEHLMCGSCALTSLNLSQNPNLQHLDAFRNKLTQLDVTNCPKLKRLDIWDNHSLGSIDISKNKGLQYYNCANNGATSINVSNNPELQKLICSYNRISSLDVSHNPKLFYLDCAVNQIGSLNLSNNPRLHFLQAFTNPFTTLDISNNEFLVKTYREGTKKSEAAVCRGHSWTINYGGASSTGGDNLYFLCFDDTVSLITEAKNTSQQQVTEQPKNNNTDTSDLITREAVVKRLYEMAGKPGVKGLKTRFKDVKAGASYEAAVLWGEKYSICIGYPNVSSDNFGVGKWISRQDLAYMLMRFAEYMNYKRAIDFGRSDDFIDYYEIDDYAWEAICWAATWNIMVGKGDPDAPKSERRIDPHGNATRTEFETMIKRLLEVNPGVTPPKVTDEEPSNGTEQNSSGTEKTETPSVTGKNDSAVTGKKDDSAGAEKKDAPATGNKEEPAGIEKADGSAQKTDDAASVTKPDQSADSSQKGDTDANPGTDGNDTAIGALDPNAPADSGNNGDAPGEDAAENAPVSTDADQADSSQIPVLGSDGTDRDGKGEKAAEEAATVTAESSAQQNGTDQKKDSKGILLPALLSVLAAALIAGSAVFVWKKKRKNA